MDLNLSRGFRLGDWTVYPGLNRLVRGDEIRTLENKVTAVLVEIAKLDGEVVDKNDLLDAVWPRQSVAEGVLARAVHQLRQALGDDAHAPRYIETIPRHGYRVLLRPQPVAQPETGPAAGATPRWLIAGTIAIVAAGALLAWQMRSADTPSRLSVAVLPFTNLTGIESKGHIGDGIAEELIHLIAQQPDILVAARTSSFALRGQGLSAHEIGEELGVDFVFEGSVREERGVQRVTIQLIDAESDVHEGSETLDLVDGDLFAAQERLADTVLTMLSEAGAAVDRTAVSLKPATRWPAYDIYLRGRAALHQRSAESLAAAREYFEEAIALDPNFAAAHAGLAQLHIVSVVYMRTDPAESVRLAGEASKKALELDPNNVDALLAAAAIASYDPDYETSMGNFERAIELQPGNAMAHQWYSEALSILGYIRDSRRSIARALSLNPLSGSANTIHAKTSGYFLDDPTLLSTASRADALDARLAPRFLALYAYRTGDTAMFEREIRRFYKAMGVEPAATDLVVEAIAGNGQLPDLLERIGAASDQPLSLFARELVFAGRHELALAALLSEPATEISFITDIWMPEFRELRQLPGFEDLLRALKLPDYWRNHGLPDACLTHEREPFCNRLVLADGS